MKRSTIFIIIFFILTSFVYSNENIIHKYKVGISTGLAYPNKVLSYPIFIGSKISVFFDMRIGIHSLFYSTINYSSYEPDNIALNSQYYPGINHVYNSKSNTPYKLYSLIGGWELTSSSTGRVPAIRIGVGLFFDYSREDEISVTYIVNSNEVVKKNIDAKDKFSAGINLRVGLDVPLYKDIIGLCADIDLNPKLIGPQSPSTTQHPEGGSLSIGFFIRF